MLVGKGKGDVARHCNPSTQRRQSVDIGRRRTIETLLCNAQQEFEIAFLGDRIRRMIDECVERGMFAGLDEAEMALRQGKRLVAADDGDDRHTDRFERLSQHRFVPVAADLVEDDAGDADIGTETGKTRNQRRDRLRHARGIDDEHHGKPELGGEIGRRSLSVGRPVEKPHHRLDDEDAVAGTVKGGIGRDQFRAHCPGIEIQADGGR